MSNDQNPERQLNRSGHRAKLLIRRLWSALEMSEGRRLTNEELSNYLNLSDSALSDWAAGKTELYQIEALLKLCERLDGSTAWHLFSGHLRKFPTLRAPELSHDPGSMEILRGLLFQEAGITLIFGGTTTQRTFLITAIGHSYCEERIGSHSLVGWDAHSPTWFVQVPGLVYLPEARCEPPMIALNGLAGRTVISNGLWKRFSSHRHALIRHSREHHVIVADSVDPKEFIGGIEGLRGPKSLVEVMGSGNTLQVTVKTIPEPAKSDPKAD